MKSSIRSILIVTLSIAGIRAQPARTYPVHGEIVSASRGPGSLFIELSPQGGGISESIAVNPDDTFELRSTPPGNYELRVVTGSGQILHQQIVSITPGMQTLTVRIPAPPSSANRTSGPSSIPFAQLQHKIPGPALKLYNKGEQAAAKHNLEQARDYYRQALTLDPEYVDAYIELGATESALGQHAEAAKLYRKALELAPEHPVALPNLSIVLAKMHQFQEAGEVARRALKVAPGSGRVHYILAACLIEEHGDIDEAIEHLQKSASEIPSARLIASDLLAQRGKRDAAVRQLEEYLLVAAPGDAGRSRAEARLAELRQETPKE
jgi:tetratricopeptide (TPR) repeat protein